MCNLLAIKHSLGSFLTQTQNQNNELKDIKCSITQEHSNAEVNLQTRVI